MFIPSSIISPTAATSSPRRATILSGVAGGKRLKKQRLELAFVIFVYIFAQQEIAAVSRCIS
jgi:hypothetical protein